MAFYLSLFIKTKRKSFVIPLGIKKQSINMLRKLSGGLLKGHINCVRMSSFQGMILTTMSVQISVDWVLNILLILM